MERVKKLRELFEICPKIQFFNFFGASYALRGVNLVEKDVKQCDLMCQRQPGKIPCLLPEKLPFSTFIPIFPPVPPKNLAPTLTLKLLFRKVQE